MIVGLCVIAGLYLLFGVMVMTTADFKSALLFKFIPLLIAALLFFIAAQTAGWVVHV